jgi:type IV pilus assembly protein PilY1
MTISKQFTNWRYRSILIKALALVILLIATATSLRFVFSQPTPPNIPLVDLAQEPLYLNGAKTKPAVVLALSVEYPTAGAAYSNNTFNIAQEYVGYFDPNGCYQYDQANSRFNRYGATPNKQCNGNGFSGNFMNWAGSSAIDILRYGLTGGDRVLDTDTETVLQRAVIPRRNDMYGGNVGAYFPTKTVSGTVAFQVLPRKLLELSTSATSTSFTATVNITNCLNQIHFGTGNLTGNAGLPEEFCRTPGANSDFGDVSAPAVTATDALPTGFTECASEGGTCAVDGLKQVVYGRTSSPFNWSSRIVTGPIPCTNAMFANPGGSTRKCYIRDISALNSDNNLAFEGRYVVRNKVCDAAEAATRPDLCLAYPNGQFKPTGNIQRNSDRVRISAFGYLQEDGTGRYGGVMRAPLKYVGPKTFDSDFNESSVVNASREWDANTGVFFKNPLSETEGISGVTNYLNQFGRLRDFGRYKGNDPVGELYYESVRYLQGQQPTSQAVSSLNATNRDNYPVYTSWTDPHPAITGNADYSCLRNNIILLGDIGTHADKSLPGNNRTGDNDFVRTVLAGEPNAYAWTGVVSGFEKNISTSYVDSQGRTQITSNPNSTAAWNNTNNLADVNTGAGSAAYYMAGVAYWANTQNIRSDRPGMRIRTFAIDVNQNNSSGNATTRRQSQFFLTGKYGGFDDRNSDGTPFSRNPNGTPDNSKWEGAPGEAKNYFKIDSPQGLLTSLTDIFDKIVEETGSIAGGAIASQKVTASSSSAIFQAKFDPMRWGGSVEKVQVSLASVTATNVTIGTVSWDAGDVLKTRVSGTTTTGSNTRNIYIGNLANRTTALASTFTWANLQQSHKDLLSVDPENGQIDTLGSDRVSFLRGFRGKESPDGPFRRRSDVLGDIINSGLQFVGAPSKISLGTGYKTFYDNNKNRDEVIYVGANDGMLHAFKNTDGSELFAYIPSFLTSKLKFLTNPKYIHQSYVDATPGVGEAFVNSEWKTVLVSGVGAGAQGVFALDVTNPSTFSASNVMWEFTDKDDANLGNVVGQPKILKLRTSANGVTPAVTKWFAVFTSGVNSHQNDGNFSTTGKPALFILDLSKSISEAWVKDSNYYRIDFPIADPTLKVGMLNFEAILGDSSQLQLVYAGDLQGNLWRLDFDRAGVDNWTLDKLSNHVNSSNQAIPFYIAKASDGARQPISTTPAVVYGLGKQKVVMFGTGKFIEQSDITNNTYQTQSFYALLDNGTVNRVSSRSSLKQVNINADQTITPSSAMYWGFNTANGQNPGWYTDFRNSASTGERQISDLVDLYGNLYFSSILPATSGCGVGGGNSYQIDIFGARGYSEQSQVGILAPPLLLQVGDAIASGSDPTGRGTRTTRFVVINQGSKGVSRPTSPNSSYSAPPDGVFRLSWRVIPNFKEQKAAP